eukprot:scaffold116_cov334-Pavlova_lutheri.AAC.70
MKGDEGGTPPRWKQGGKGGGVLGGSLPLSERVPREGEPRKGKGRGSIPGEPDKEMGKDRSKHKENRGWGKGRGEREGLRGREGDRG